MFTLKTPAKIIWELTARCTRSCHICFNCSCRENADTLTPPQREKIFAQVLAANPLHVIFTGGEPLLLADELVWMMRQLRSKDVYTQLWTNADLLSQLRIDELTGNCDMVTLPLWGKDERSHDKIMGEGSFAAIMDALERLSGVTLEIAWVLTKENYGDLGDALTVLSKYKQIYCITLHHYVQAGRGRASDCGIPETAIEELMADIVRLNESHKTNPRIHMSDENAEINNLLRGQLFNYQAYLAADGNVLPHPYLPYSVGNASQQPLNDIWRDALATFWSRPAVRQAFRGCQGVGNMALKFNADNASQMLSA